MTQHGIGHSFRSICSPTRTCHSKLFPVSAIWVTVSMLSKSYLESTMHYLFSHGSYSMELPPHGKAPSVDQRQGSQIPKIYVLHFILSGLSSAKTLSLLDTCSKSFHATPKTIKGETDEHPSHQSLCVVQLLILSARCPAREWASIYIFSYIIDRNAPRRSFGLPLIMSGTTPISDLGTPCA